MSFLKSLFIGWIGLLLLGGISVAQERITIIDDFEDEAIGALPAQWFNRDANRSTVDMDAELRATYFYSVLEEGGNRFLRFEGINGKHMSYPFKKRQKINLNLTPWLQWRWRIRTIPEGADETDKSKNDFAASIYVVYKVNWLKIPTAIKYTWSSKLPEGEVLTQNYGKLKVVIVGTGKNQNGQWISFKRNVQQDFKKLFGKKAPRHPIALLILSDGDDVNQVVSADYDDIIFTSQ